MIFSRGLIARLSSGQPVGEQVQGDLFPLSVDSSGRYLIDANGTPFLIHGDTPWSLAVQLTTSEITTYIADRAEKGFTAILFNAIEHYFSSQTPRYKTVDGYSPFSSMTDFGSSLVENYWSRIDHIVDTAKSYDITCIINPAYLGYGGGSQGWMSEITAETAGDLQTYGAALANRYTQGNVIWCMGGDYEGTSTERDKQWNIVTGMRTVRTTDIIMSHAGPGDEGYSFWNGYTGWNFNTIYTYDGVDYGDYIYTEAAAAYGRSGPLPFIFFEGRYEQEPNPAVSAAYLRRQSYASLLSGACGQMFGNNPIWNFEAPDAIFSYSGTWESNLDSTGSVHQQYVKQLFSAYEWWKLVPKRDTTVVTSSLSSGQTALYPALASDGTFAMVWVPSSQTVTVDKSALSVNPLRIRLYNTTDGTYSTHTASTTNSGTADVATGGERVIVLDAA